MMNFLLALAALAAVGLVWLAHRHLNRAAIIWLGVLFAFTAGVALLLDFLTDDIRASLWSGQKSPTGESLFAIGPEISILGASWPFTALCFLFGLALIVVGLCKKAARRTPESVDDEAFLMDDDVARIGRELDAEITELAGGVDPAMLGQQDAAQPGGAVPSARENKPTGNEKNIRERYMHLAEDFLQRTVRVLQKDIADAFARLLQISDAVETTPYQQIAQAHYNESRPQETDQQIKETRKAVTQANNAIVNFRRRLKLSPDEELDWVNGKLSVWHLISWGAVLAVIEFVVNYALLAGEIGANQALIAALLAVVIVMLLAFAFAWTMQFVRRGQPPAVRALGATCCVLLFVMFVCAFGLLLGWRDAAAADIAQAEGAFAKLKISLDVIGGGYVSVLGSTPNIAVFIVNVLAFGVFGWKVVLWTDKFRGYSILKIRFDVAKAKWDAFLQAHETSVREAVDEANQTANSNARLAEQAILIIRTKNATLKNLRQIINGAYTTKLYPAYSADISEYRQANVHNRELAVDPTPTFWEGFPELAEVDSHFTADLGIDKFFQDNRELLGSVDAYLQSVRKKSDDWHGKSADLGTKWSEQFDTRLKRIH